MKKFILNFCLILFPVSFLLAQGASISLSNLQVSEFVEVDVIEVKELGIQIDITGLQNLDEVLVWVIRMDSEEEVAYPGYKLIEKEGKLYLDREGYFYPVNSIGARTFISLELKPELISNWKGVKVAAKDKGGSITVPLVFYNNYSFTSPSLD